MATRNDVTGDSLVSHPASEDYRNNYDEIFRKTVPQPKQHPQPYQEENGYMWDGSEWVKIYP